MKSVRQRSMTCLGLPQRLVLALMIILATGGAALAGLPRLEVSDDGRFLVYEDGRPFFWLGDTAWELFHRLDRQQAERYLRNRADKGYTVIQAVALAELDGHSDPNPYGHLPLIDFDPARPAIKEGPANDYWDHVDYIVDKANELGLYIGFLPTWGRYWHDNAREGRPLFTPENAGIYGRWLGRRYRDKDLVWILGGDRTIENDQHKRIMRAMAHGLREGDGGAHLISFHPRGGQGSAESFHNEDWLDFNMRQNGHNVKFDEGFQNTRADYERTPIKPVLDGEPIYEDHPVSFQAERLGHSIASDVRRPLYWDLFTGAFGHTYGHHSVWQMWQPGRHPVNNPLMPWFEAIDQPGAGHMQYGRWLIESRPFLTRIPDDSILVAHHSDPDARATQNATVNTELTHVVYTRNQSGKATLYIDGDRVAAETIGGELSAWQNGLYLALGNELTEDRPWQGELHRVAIYGRALEAEEIAGSAETRRSKRPAGPLALYTFDEGHGQTVRDNSASGTPMHLQIQDASAVQWLAGGGLRISRPTVIASSEPAQKIIDAVRKSGTISIEAWIRPANTTQAGPARIVTISRDTGVRNVTLGQKGTAYEVRLRTTATSANGEPALSWPQGDTLTVPTAVPGAGRYRFVATRDRDRTYGMVYAPVGRRFTVRMDAIDGPRVKAWWYNPRTGEATVIGTFDSQAQRQFTPPNQGEMLDWVLVLDDAEKGYPAPGYRSGTSR